MVYLIVAVYFFERRGDQCVWTGDTFCAFGVDVPLMARVSNHEMCEKTCA